MGSSPTLVTNFLRISFVGGYLFPNPPRVFWPQDLDPPPLFFCEVALVGNSVLGSIGKEYDAV